METGLDQEVLSRTLRTFGQMVGVPNDGAIRDGEPSVAARSWSSENGLAAKAATKIEDENLRQVVLTQLMLWWDECRRVSLPVVMNGGKRVPG